MPSGGNTKYRGVFWLRRAKKFKAQLRIDGYAVSLGQFDDPALAAKAYDDYLAHLVMVGDRKREECIFNFQPLRQLQGATCTR